MVVSGKPNDGIEKGLVTECNVRQDQSEKVVGVRDHTVMVMCDIFTKIVEVELKFRRKGGPVWTTARSLPGEIGEL
jgi:hypothetical protein